MQKPNVSKRETQNSNLCRRLLITIVALICLSSSQALAAISFVKTVGTDSWSSGGSGLSIFVPAAGVAAGNSVIVTLAFDPVAGSAFCSDTRGNTYSVDKDFMNGSGTSGLRVVILSAHNVIAMPNPTAINCNHPFSSSRVMSVNEFSGLAPFSTLDQTASATGTGTAPSSGTTSTTSQAAELLVGVVGVEGKSTETFTAGSGYTTIGRIGTSQGNAASNITINPEYKIVSTSGAYSATGTMGTSAKWATGIITYKALIPPTKLAIVSVNGGSNPTADTPFTVTVQAQNLSGNPANVSVATGVNLSLKTGTGPLGGTLVGTISAGANQVTISGITYTKAESGVSLTASRTSGDLLSAGDSTAFTVNPGPPAVLAFVTQPGSTSSGATIPGPPTVVLRDAFGNNVTTSTSVTVTFGDFIGGATLSGTTTKSTTGGSVSFADLSINKANSGYTLRASVTGIPNATSNPFNVNPGTATKLGFTTQPGNSTTTGAMVGPPIITVQDSQGNTITSSTALISVAIGTNPGGATLAGTTSRNANTGIAPFANLKIDQPGSGYTLVASSSGLTSATSNTFNIATAGSVAGGVTKSAGGGAIIGASVQALQSGMVKGTATTDSTGNYSISGLVPGTYDLRANAGGFSPQTQSGGTVTGGATATANFTLTTTNPTAGIVYLYDELQRLKSVIDPVGEATTYSYDAVGNLLSITRNNSSQTSIIDFNPNSGPVGSAVTIYGTGYSTTPSQNTVTFNGVAATVISSTLTQIAVTVPVGATAGPIAVTSPSGSGTSSTIFSVTGALAGSPTIGGFTPTIGTVGTAVTISGTNFDAIPANNETYFNPTFAAVTTATSTTLGTAVPVAGQSGKLRVSTPAGTAVSTQDFFVPPSPFTVSDVDFAARLSIGGPSLVMSVATANKIALALFEGVAGQRVSLNVTNSTFPTGGTSASLKILTPQGFQIGTVDWNAATGVFLDALTLPMTATYTILVDPTGTNTGQATVQLYSATDVTGPIVPGGAAIPLPLNTSGQNARLTFTGNAGDKVSGTFTAGTLLCCGNGGFSGNVQIVLLKPNGATVGSFGGYWADGWMETVTLPESGTYTVLVDPPGTTTGTGTVRLFAVADITGPITPGGASVPLNVTTPGQNARLTFSGNAGDKISGHLTAGTLLCCGNGGFSGNMGVSLLKPDGTTLGSFGGYWADGWMDTVTLPTSGTYTLFVDPAGAAAGTATVQLYTVTDITGPITPGGAAVSISITTPGQNAYYSFNATSGDKISGTYTAAGTILCCGSGGFSGNLGITIRKPPNWQITVGGFGGSWGNGSLGTTTLPDTGEYQVFFDPEKATTGTGTIQLFVVP